MKMTPVLLMVLILASTAGWAGEPQSAPGLSTDRFVEPLQEPTLSLFSDFRSRVQAAMESGELARIVALYQTNGVTAEELNSEIARWKRMVGQDGKTVSVFFKDLSRLPPESHKYWSAEAQRLTQREVTHFAIVTCPTGQLILPLVALDDKLLIVAPEKMRAKGIEPGSAANRSQPAHSDANRSPAAAGSGR